MFGSLLGSDKKFTFALLPLGRASILNLGPNRFFFHKREKDRGVIKGVEDNLK